MGLLVSRYRGVLCIITSLIITCCIYDRFLFRTIQMKWRRRNSQRGIDIQLSSWRQKLHQDYSLHQVKTEETEETNTQRFRVRDILQYDHMTTTWRSERCDADQRWRRTVLLSGAVEVVLFDVGLVDGEGARRSAGTSLRRIQSVPSDGLLLWSHQIKGKLVSDGHRLLLHLKHTQKLIMKSWNMNWVCGSSVQPGLTACSYIQISIQQLSFIEQNCKDISWISLWDGCSSRLFSL